MSPCVSVIIPAFNCREWVREAVESALVQSESLLEVIVVDDGSTDGTPEVLSGFGDRVRVLRQENRGVAAARNAGLGVARGEFIAFLDADDVWHPRKLELQLAVMRERPEIGVLATGVFAWPAETPPGTGEERASPVVMARRDLAVKNYLATSSVIVRREVMERVGAFDEDLRGPEDHDYWLRASEVAEIAVLPVPLTGYRTVAGSLSTRATPMGDGIRRILRKLDEREFWSGDWLLRRRAYAYAEASCAHLHGCAGDQVRAIAGLVRSFLWYPLPFRRREAGASCVRLRRLGVAVLRMARVIAPAGSRQRASASPADAVECPGCGEDKSRVLHRREFRSREWSLARCRECGLHFTSPRPTDADVRGFYEGDYHAALRAPGAAESAFRDKFGRYVDSIARHLPRGRVVDVGCSTGLLVRMLRDRGFEAEGVEFNARSAAWGRSHYRVPIHAGSAEECFEPGSVDGMVLGDVLEHTPHPREFLRRIRGLLAPGGVALITFPNIRSVESCWQRMLARALRREWLWSACHIPLHVWEFTPGTAAACFEQAGFEVVEFRRTQPGPERHRSTVLNLLMAPMRVLSWGPLARRWGTQMEFVIRRADAERARGGVPLRFDAAAGSASGPSLGQSLLGAACVSFQPLALNALSVPVMAFIIRRLGAEGYGRWMVATALLSACATVASLGLRGTFVRSVAAAPDSARRALAEQLGLRLLLTLLVGAVAVPLCLVLGYPAPVLWCTVVGLAGLALTTCASSLADVLQAFHRIKSIAAVNGAAGLSLTVVSAVVAWEAPGPVAIAAAYLTGPLVAAVMFLVLVRTRICPVSVRWDLRRFARLLRESRFFAAQQLLAVGSAQAEGLLLPRIIGIGPFGFFTAGALPANRLTALPDGLCTAAYPAMVKACAGGPARAAGMVLRYLVIAAVVGVALALAATLVAGPLGEILFPGRSAGFVRIACITVWSLPLVAVESLMGNALNAAGRDSEQARVSVPAAAVSLVIAVALVCSAGLTGACWSMVLRPGVRAGFLAPLMVRTFRVRRGVAEGSAAFAGREPLLRKAG